MSAYNNNNFINLDKINASNLRQVVHSHVMMCLCPMHVTAVQQYSI